jgi:hypothetical protein
LLFVIAHVLDGTANRIALAPRSTILGLLWLLHDLIASAAAIPTARGTTELREQILDRCIASELLIGIIWCAIDLSFAWGL